MTKTAFITGVSAGLGYSLAELFNEQKYQVCGLSRQKPSSLSFIRHLCIDLALLEDLEEKISTLLNGIQKIDIVVLNAAHMGVVEDLRDTSTRFLREIMDINLWSNKIIIDTLFNQKIEVSQVIAISSGMSQGNHRGGNGYALSKAALNKLIELYAAEEPATHFCSLAPGIIDTAMQSVLEAHPQTEKFSILQKLEQARNKGAMLSPEDTAKKLIDSLPKILDYPSGSYVDLRELN